MTAVTAEKTADAAMESAPRKRRKVGYEKVENPIDSPFFGRTIDFVVVHVVEYFLEETGVLVVQLDLAGTGFLSRVSTAPQIAINSSVLSSPLTSESSHPLVESLLCALEACKAIRIFEGSGLLYDLLRTTTEEIPEFGRDIFLDVIKWTQGFQYVGLVRKIHCYRCNQSWMAHYKGDGRCMECTLQEAREEAREEGREEAVAFWIHIATLIVLSSPQSHATRPVS
ncbi:hypothetical protein BDV95DRAFT_597496 [Massariosphaeria phaeospora]|uniref:Uncharacterized protein n=1 Tax=Massariosphaeria phaeospora TaxID=100035 RepID=A0A7C8MAG8_9PLEO|nr:hypothetical protein BDV95DRAFT_597496 [Massariosphaeria phaeospora]